MTLYFQAVYSMLKGLQCGRIFQQTLSDILGQPVVDMNQIANQVFVQLELSNGRMKIYRMVFTGGKPCKKQ